MFCMRFWIFSSESIEYRTGSKIILCCPLSTTQWLMIAFVLLYSFRIYSSEGLNSAYSRKR